MPTIEPLAIGATAFIDVFPQGPQGEPVQIAGLPEFENTFGPASDTEGGVQVGQFFSNGGKSAWILRPDSGGFSTALDPATSPLYRIPERPSLLCVPATAHLDDASARSLWQTAIELCRKLHAVLLIDPPAGLDEPRDMLRWAADHAGILQDSRAVLFYPRLIAANPGREIATSGSVAGIYARIAERRGIWRAPIGNEAGIRKAEPARKLTDSEQERLSAAGINAVRHIAPTGPMCLGARTMDTEGWRYVHVRRFADWLTESIARGLRWTSTVPNGEGLWNESRDTVAEFLDGLWRQGALQGSSAQDAYFVRCDAAAQAGASEGSFYLLAGFAPLKPAEFVVLKIRASATS